MRLCNLPLTYVLTCGELENSQQVSFTKFTHVANVHLGPFESDRIMTHREAV